DTQDLDHFDDLRRQYDLARQSFKGEVNRLVDYRAAILRHNVPQRRRQRRVSVKAGEVDCFEIAPEGTEIARHGAPCIERGIKLRRLGRAIRQEGQATIRVGDGKWRVVVRREDEARPAFGLIELFVLALDPAHLARGVDQLFYALIRLLLVC